MFYSDIDGIEQRLFLIILKQFLTKERNLRQQELDRFLVQYKDVTDFE